MEEKKKEGKEGQGGFDVTVKISGTALRQVMAVRGEREKHTGRISSIAELVREAIDCWHDGEAEAGE